MNQKSNKAFSSMFGLANLITMFVFIVVGTSVMGPIAQVSKNAACISNQSIPLLSSLSSPSNDLSTSQPEGTTDSFGGAGSNRFGGYNNKVTHDSFLNKIASTSVVKTDKSILNPDCQQLSPSVLFFIDNFTIIFILGNILFVIVMYNSRMFGNDYYSDI